MLVAERFLDRELSWLDFNERVLHVAARSDTPLLERAKFLAIHSTNLDEFFMVRVAGLKRQVEAGINGSSGEARTPRRQLQAIAEKTRPQVQRRSEIFASEVKPALDAHDIHLARWSDLSEIDQKELTELFERQIFPVVTPLAVDPGHPFPYISNLSLNLAVLVHDPEHKKEHFARVKVPPVLPRFFAIADTQTFVPVEDVIAANLDELFPGMEIVEHYAFRVTRNADLEMDDDGAEDLLQALEDELSRRRFSPAVRLEIEEDMPRHVLELLVRELQVDEEHVYAVPGPLDLSALWSFFELDRPDLKFSSFIPVTPPGLTSSDDSPTDIFSALGEHDVLVQHPYNSFKASVQRFIEQAAEDPHVLAIKQTLYRTSGESPIVDALIDAATAGKQVVVLVEIKARFDERANINWARALERAGCHVVYGVVGLKTHCKLCLVVRQEGSELKRYVHVGTGNYNPKTARIYEDLGLLTSNPRIGVDVSDLFNYLTGYSRHRSYSCLIVAPDLMRERIVEMIDREARLADQGQPGHIMMKLNSLVDETVIDALYDASQRGVKIDLLIRSICALKPAVEGLSDNITVRSVVGRFLEHSRILFFKNGGDEEYFIGSADMMHRNLDRRVEALVPVEASDLQRKICSIFTLAFEERVKCWALQGDGTWDRVGADDAIDFQEELIRRALDHA